MQVTSFIRPNKHGKNKDDNKDWWIGLIFKQQTIRQNMLKSVFTDKYFSKDLKKFIYLFEFRNTKLKYSNKSAKIIFKKLEEDYENLIRIMERRSTAQERWNERLGKRIMRNIYTIDNQYEKRVKKM